MNHIGLFEGIGGFSLAARWMGWNTIAWCEIDKFCQTVLKHHFPDATGHSDIRATDFVQYRGQCDILTGGFPCQPYSVAGKRQGKEDERHLWPEMLRAIREIQPRYVVGENVGGLLSWSGGLVFEEVHTDMEAYGYEVQAFVIPACAVDAPHRRDRVWFIATNTNQQRGESGIARKHEEKRREERLKTRGLKNKTETRTGLVSESQRSGSNGPTTHTSRTRWQQFNLPKQPNATQHSTRCSDAEIPDWRHFPTQSPLCSGDDGLPTKLDGITISKHRRESIKAYGNAIVPQVAYQIFKAITQCHN
jgi:DNA (cytosine-5)-methyltransferase 1